MAEHKRTKGHRERAWEMGIAVKGFPCKVCGLDFGSNSKPEKHRLTQAHKNKVKKS